MKQKSSLKRCALKAVVFPLHRKTKKKHFSNIVFKYSYFMRLLIDAKKSLTKINRFQKVSLLELADLFRQVYTRAYVNESHKSLRKRLVCRYKKCNRSFINGTIHENDHHITLLRTENYNQSHFRYLNKI